GVDLALRKGGPEERSFHRVSVDVRLPLPRSARFGADARFVEIAVPEAERDAERAACVAGRRLNPDLLERSLAQQPPVADAVERDAAGEAEIAQTGFAVRERGHLQHHLF